MVLALFGFLVLFYFIVTVSEWKGSGINNDYLPNQGSCYFASSAWKFSILGNLLWNLTPTFDV